LIDRLGTRALSIDVRQCGEVELNIRFESVDRSENDTIRSRVANEQTYCQARCELLVLGSMGLQALGLLLHHIVHPVRMLHFRWHQQMLQR
jgi:hypothetical protein